MSGSVVQNIANDPRQGRRITGQPRRLHAGVHVECRVGAQAVDLAAREIVEVHVLTGHVESPFIGTRQK
jgi:hypothetical protein